MGNTQISQNPFFPSFGRLPTILLNQESILHDYLTGLTSQDGKHQTSLVYGVRGSGKTVFLLNVEQNLKLLKNWYCLRLTLSQDNLIMQLILGLQKIEGINWKQVLKHFSAELNFSMFGITFKSNSSTQVIDYKGILEQMLSSLKKRNIFVLIEIDEMEVSSDVRAFASMYQMLIGEEYNLALLMTGLPNRLSELQNDQVLTFLLRSNRIYLSQLAQDDVINKYQMTFQQGNKLIDPLDLELLAQSAGGYPYAFQTVGYYAWRFSKDVINQTVIEQTISATKQDLYRNSYDKLYTELSPTDQKFLQAMASYTQKIVPISFVQTTLGKPKNYLSVYRARLKDSQLITIPERGKVTFSLPYFKYFIHSYNNSHLL